MPPAAEALLARLAAIEGLDVAFGLKIVQGDAAQLLRLLRMFADTHGGDMLAALQWLGAGDIAQAQRLAHGLRGVAATLGIRSVLDTATALDTALHDQRGTAEYMQLAQTCRAALAHMVQVIRALPAPSP